MPSSGRTDRFSYLMLLCLLLYLLVQLNHNECVCHEDRNVQAPRGEYILYVLPIYISCLMELIVSPGVSSNCLIFSLA